MRVRLNEKYKGKNEIGIILDTDKGRRIEFMLRKHQVKNDPLDIVELEIVEGGEKKKLHKSWYNILTEQERVAVFNMIMAHYRLRSEGDEGYRGAAIGVFEVPDGRHKIPEYRIFVGVNTKRQHQYFKDCAELNMSNAATDALNNEAVEKGRSIPEKRVPIEVHVMGGKEPEKEDPGLAISCPCGKCIDMFSNNHMDKKTRVYAHPIPLGDPPKEWTDETFPYTLVPESKKADLGRVKPDREIWNVKFDHLNKDRALDVNIKTARIMASGLREALLHNKRHMHEQPNVLDRINLSTEAARRYMDPELDNRTMPPPRKILAAAMSAHADGNSNWVKITGHTKREVPRILSVIAKAAENAATDTTSIPDLDIARRDDGTIGLADVNPFMVNKIRAAMASRLRQSGIDPKTDPEWEKKFLEKVGTVRCAVVQLADGTFHYGLEVEGALDNAMPNAEVNAVAAAAEKLGEKRIQHVWVMEMNPADIALDPAERQGGGTMHTSPKEGLERIVKRALPGVAFTFLPFNSGKIGEKTLTDISQQYDTPGIHPGRYSGVKKISRTHIGGPATSEAER